MKISPETYLAMQASSAFDRFEEQGVMFENEEGGLEIAPEFDMTNEEFDEVDFAVNMAISSIKASASMLTKAGVDKKLIPTFVKFDFENYITIFENDIKEAKAQIENIDLPDIDELPSLEEMLEMNEAPSVELFAQIALANLPKQIEMQENMLEKFKTSKAAEVKEMLEELSIATNSMLYCAIQHGFEGNARAVVADLGADFELYNTPEIIDNEDGTLTYSYTTMLGGKYEVTKNKENGDYISAASFDVAGKIGFVVDFNKDGSIKNLDYVNGIDKSIVNVSQKGNRVVVKQIFNNLVTERQFVINDDNALKLTFANIYTK